MQQDRFTLTAKQSTITTSKKIETIRVTLLSIPAKKHPTKANKNYGY